MQLEDVRKALATLGDLPRGVSPDDWLITTSSEPEEEEAAWIVVVLPPELFESADLRDDLADRIRSHVLEEVGAGSGAWAYVSFRSQDEEAPA